MIKITLVKAVRINVCNELKWKRKNNKKAMEDI